MPNRIRTSSYSTRVGLSAATYVFAATAAHAQCDSQWLPQGIPDQTSGIIYALTTRDPDGAGPFPGTLFAGGFSLGTAGNIASWSPQANNWQPLGPGTNGTVYALASNGADVFVGGRFTIAGGIAASHIARWDGAAWHPMGDGLPGATSTDGVYTLGFLPNNQLVAGGSFGDPSGVNRDGVFVWDGQSWSPMRGAFSGAVRALAIHNGELFAGGGFYSLNGANALNVAQWDGTAWHAIGGVIQRTVFSLQSFRGELFAGGFDGPSPTFGAWNGQSWRTVPSGPTGTINAMLVFNGELIVGGVFRLASAGPFKSIARWSGIDGEPWRDLDGGVLGDVYALTPIDAQLGAGGFLSTADGVSTNRWARWRPELVPTSSTNPNVSTVCNGRGRRATLSLTATGAPPITYQWRRAGTPLVNILDRISGVTTPTLSISSATYADNGPYDCVVTATCGSATSAAATLTICFADYNCQGGATIDDVYLFLADYFAHRTTADVNGSGTVTVQDLLDFIAGYLRGC